MRLSGEDKRILFSGRSNELFAGDPGLFVDGLHPAPITELFELDLAFHQLLIFIGVIITPFANGATHGD